MRIIGALSASFLAAGIGHLAAPHADFLHQVIISFSAYFLGYAVARP